MCNQPGRALAVRPEREVKMSGSDKSEPVHNIAFERQYSVTEIAAMWGRSDDFVRRAFQNEPGVIKIVSNGTLKKRKYTTLLIPASVVENWHRKNRT